MCMSDYYKERYEDMCDVADKLKERIETYKSAAEAVGVVFSKVDGNIVAKNKRAEKVEIEMYGHPSNRY